MTYALPSFWERVTLALPAKPRFADLMGAGGGLAAQGPFTSFLPIHFSAVATGYWIAGRHLYHTSLTPLEAGAGVGLDSATLRGFTILAQALEAP